MEPVWIEWCDECELNDIPVEYPIEGVSSVRDTFDEVQDHIWALVYSILSLCPQCRSSQHISWFHLNTCLPSVSKRMNGRSLNLSWSCVGVSISHSMKNPYLSNVMSDSTHLIGFRLIFSITCSRRSDMPTNSEGIIRCMAPPYRLFASR